MNSINANSTCNNPPLANSPNETASPTMDPTDVEVPTIPPTSDALEALEFETLVKIHMATMAEVNEDLLLVGTIFESKLIAYATVLKFVEDKGYKVLFDAHAPNKKKDPDYILHRWKCQRAGKPRNRNTGIRPNRVSLKCDCAMKICLAPFYEGRGVRNLDKLKVVSSNLEHTNGCIGNDLEMHHSNIEQQHRLTDIFEITFVVSYPYHVLP